MSIASAVVSHGDANQLLFLLEESSRVTVSPLSIAHDVVIIFLRADPASNVAVISLDAFEPILERQ